MFISTQIKKLQIFLSLAIISCIVMISCTSSASDSWLFPVVVSEKVGFINNQGKLVIEAKIDYSKGDKPPTFSLDGLAAVKKEGKCGYIDKTGKTVIGFQYSLCKPFSEGLAFVRKTIETPRKENGSNIIRVDDVCTYIDKLGNEVIDFKKNNFDCYGQTYKHTFSEGLSTFMVNNKIGFMDKSGKVIIQPQFYDWGDGDGAKFSEGIALVMIPSESNPRQQSLGYIDKVGRVVIKSAFASANNFSEGLATVSYQIGERTSKFGYIDVTGKTIIQPQFDVAGEFSDGLARVAIDKKRGYIDKSGKLVIEGKYDGIGKFSEGLAPVKLNNKWGFIDKTGRMVIEPTYKGVDTLNYLANGAFSNGLAIVIDENNAFGYIDKTGKYVWQPTK